MRLSFQKQFVAVSHLLAAVGVGALATTHEVGGGYVAVALGGLGWSAWREWRGDGEGISERAANVCMLVALVLSLAPVLLQGASAVRAIAQFLLVLTGLKAAARKQDRDWMQVLVLSFFQLLAAAALTVEPVFALLFFAYLLLAPCALVLFQLRREIGAFPSARRLDAEPFVEPSLFRSLATTTAVLFLSTVVIFVVFPRVGAGYFASPFVGGQVLTGFSEEVGLGSVAALKQDAAVALRVTVDRPELLQAERYWRGAALDHFDGRNWHRRPKELHPLMRPEPGVFTTLAAAPRRAVVREEVILEPQDSAALFFAGFPLEIRGRFSEISIDATGNVRVIRPPGVRTRYEVVASLAPRRVPPTADALQLPVLDRRIIELGRSLVADWSGEAARADALLRFFRNGFQYTLEPGDPGSQNPLTRFLFQTRRGHCEYFASAYAVLLRAVGIPSVLVTGYAGGEWNPYGKYFLIRQSDAHSWVEAYVDGAWRLYDPTPSSAPLEPGLRRKIGEVIDALQMRWYRYVINYTLEDQAEAALSLRDASARLWRSLSRDWRTSFSMSDEAAGETGVPWRAVALVLTLAAIAAWGWRRGRRDARSPDGAISRVTRSYLILLQALAARGLEKRAAETPLEFCRRIAPRLDGHAPAVAEVTALYHEARFSGRPGSSPALDRAVEKAVAALAVEAPATEAR
jgi:transglutaminase-like putative cysteine protease